MGTAGNHNERSLIELYESDCLLLCYMTCHYATHLNSRNVCGKTDARVWNGCYTKAGFPPFDIFQSRGKRKSGRGCLGENCIRCYQGIG